jgi:hypothetical protein
MEENGDPVSVNNTTVVMASQLERLMGSKKAKKMANHDMDIASAVASQTDEINKLTVCSDCM